MYKKMYIAKGFLRIRKKKKKKMSGQQKDMGNFKGLFHIIQIDIIYKIIKFF